jgi:hypothetical protein
LLIDEMNFVSRRDAFAVRRSRFVRRKKSLFTLGKKSQFIPQICNRHKSENECRDVKFYVFTRVSSSALLNLVDV